MHRALSSRWLNNALRIGDALPASGVSLFLCPTALHGSRLLPKLTATPVSQLRQRRMVHAEAASKSNDIDNSEGAKLEQPTLPLTCSGCGAFAQTHDSNQLGYYDVTAKRVRNWRRLQDKEATTETSKEEDVINEVLKSMDSAKREELGLNAESLVNEDKTAVLQSEMKSPLCDRCHSLIHHSAASEAAKVQMYHPTVETLRETIEESPHKYNHIYHVIDAADFPMSLIPRLNVLLGDIPLRTRNRRSRSDKYQGDRKTEMSFIITRSDLLGPTKEMVDAMLPYIRDVLRDTLGRVGDRVRLGNVRCVSARRSWWTKEVKEDIWRRGGAGWMVGKVNVGKSQLFEAVYPKGRMGETKEGNTLTVSTFARDEAQAESIVKSEVPSENVHYGDLLPPLRPATNYPEMPLVSSLPGTTASPIRIPYGDGKGELIDLPGLARSDLELFVKEEHRKALIMKTRVVPEQLSVKPGQSLLLGGGLIRITPRSPNLIFLMYNFTPIEEHLTSTEKAIEFQEQSRSSAGLENITVPGVGGQMKHAGTFRLCHDVTKRRAGPLTRKNAIGLQTDRLPFRVLSTDILIEGVGYIEIVAQIRAKDMPTVRVVESLERGDEDVRKAFDGNAADDPFDRMMALRKGSEPLRKGSKPLRKGSEPLRKGSEPLREQDKDSGSTWPSVDVYTPEGRFIGIRRPIHGWLNNKPRVLAIHKKSRPRKSMKGEKKKAKIEKRMATQTPQV